MIASICLVGYNYNYLKGTQLGLAGIGGVIVPTLSPLITTILAIFILNQSIKKKDIERYRSIIKKLSIRK